MHRTPSLMVVQTTLSKKKSVSECERDRIKMPASEASWRGWVEGKRVLVREMSLMKFVVYCITVTKS